MDQRRATPFARPLHRVVHGGEALHEVAAVDAHHLQMRKALDEIRDRSTRRLHLDRNRNGVAVVLDEVNDGELLVRRRVERFPELAFAGGPIAKGAVHDFIAPELRKAIRNGVDPLVQPTRFGGTNGVQTLRSGWAALRDDVQRRAAPVRRHLPAVRRRIVFRADRLQQHVVRGDAQRQAQGAVAIVGAEPVMPRPHHHARSDENRFVAGAADLEKDLALVLELNLLVVESSRQEHQPIGGAQVVGGEFSDGRGLAVNGVV